MVAMVPEKSIVQPATEPACAVQLSSHYCQVRERTVRRWLPAREWSTGSAPIANNFTAGDLRRHAGRTSTIHEKAWRSRPL